MNSMVLFLLFLVWVLPFINPPTAEANAEPPGNLIASIAWNEGNIDVDLWLNGPAEPVAIGYSNKGGVLWNLLRDDLGDWPDAGRLNYENAYTRGVVPGEYTINAHCYRCPQLPVTVDLEVSFATMAGEPGVKSGTKVIFTTSAQITKDHQEITLINFRMDAEGNVDPASLNHVFRALRAGGKS